MARVPREDRDRRVEKAWGLATVPLQEVRAGRRVTVGDRVLAEAVLQAVGLAQAGADLQEAAAHPAVDRGLVAGPGQVAVQAPAQAEAAVPDREDEAASNGIWYS
jgi:hypothetical protein